MSIDVPENKAKRTFGGFNLDARITLLTNDEGVQFGAANNPKRGKAAERFARYRSGMTVEQARDALIRSGDLRHDTSRGFISVSEPQIMTG